MTISSQTCKNTYEATAGIVNFPYDFKIFKDTDLSVVVRDANGVEYDQVLLSHYTVAGAGSDSGGTVTFLTAPYITYGPGSLVMIERQVPYTQEVDLVDTEPYSAESLEDVLDKHVMLVQQVKSEADRALKINRTSSPISVDLPDPAMHPGQILRINSEGTGFEAIPIVESGYAVDVLDYCETADLSMLHGLASTVILASEHSSLANAIAAAGDNPVCLVVDIEQIIDSAVVVPDNIRIIMTGAGRFTKSSSGYLSIGGNFFAPPNAHIFYGFSAGDVTFITLKTVHPDWWGLDGTTTTDSAAMQCANDSISGGTIWLEKGQTYTCDSIDITNDVVGGGTVIQGVVGSNVFRIRAQGITIDYLTMVGLNTADTVERGIYCDEEYSNGRILHCKFSGFTHAVDVNGSLLMNKPTGWDINFNQFTNIGTNSGYVYGYGCLLADVIRFNVIGNQFYNINRHAVYLSSGTSYCIVAHNNIDTVIYSEGIKCYSMAGQNRTQHNSIVHNIIRNVPYGINLSQGSDYNLVKYNKIIVTSDVGIYIAGASGGLYPLKNVIEGNDIQGTFTYPILHTNAEGTIIKGNTGNVITSNGAVITINSTGTFTTSCGVVAIIEGNIFTMNSGTTGLKLDYTGTTDPVYLLPGNQFIGGVNALAVLVTNGVLRGHYDNLCENFDVKMSLPTGTTPSVAGLHVCRTNNTGATSISRLLNGYPGQILHIYGDDGNNTTFVHNTSYIVLPGGTNKTLGNNDTLSLVCEDGTLWHCIAYVDNPQ